MIKHLVICYNGDRKNLSGEDTMKKFLVTVLAALLALGRFAFAACDESGTPGGDTDPAEIDSD